MQELAPITLRRLRCMNMLGPVLIPDDLYILAFQSARDVEQCRVVRKRAILQRVCRQFMDDERQVCGCLVSQAHTRNRDADAPGKSADIIIWSKQNGKKVAQQSRTSLPVREWPNQLMSTTKRSQPLRELLCHFLFRLGRT